MDPFTQRMLERAKARREKLDTQLSNAGHNVKPRRSPLKDTNSFPLQTPKHPSVDIDVPKVQTAETDDVMTTQSSDSTYGSSDKPKQTRKAVTPEKENGMSMVSSVHNKLQRLGKLYSEDSPKLSSPIHRTEENFHAEDLTEDIKTAKLGGGTRLNRLAALASTINSWEDDLSHPSIVKKGDSKAEKIQARMNEQVKSASEPQPSTSGLGRRWKSNVNDFKKSNSPPKEQFGDKKVPNQASGKPEAGSATKCPLTSSPSCSKTPEKTANRGVPSSSGSNRFGSYGASPKSTSQSPGSVLSKASLFESKSLAPKAKDPAEMTLSERMALFERNKGEALIPKAPLTLSVPTKKLQASQKSTSQLGTVDQGVKNSGSKAVRTGRALFEQGFPKQELENDILRETQTERQKELEMLRSRFNKNKAEAQVAADSCIRTRKNSETNNSSTKNSPVCPVKPTPAPVNHIATDNVPPPPPLPKGPSFQSEPIQLRGSPTKRQVAGTPPKSNVMAPVSSVKRIRVSPPKPGNLYPDLAGLESTETEDETEYTVETSEAETATLDSRTETDDMYSSQYSLNSIDEASTSFEASILRVVSGPNSASKRQMNRDLDSSTSDISVLDEMDEYLDECLAKQQSQSHGPTPPKLNRAASSVRSSINSKNTQDTFRSPIKVTSKSPRRENYTSDSSAVPLMHSITLYRRQQTEIAKTPVKQIVRPPPVSDSDDYKADKREAAAVQEKIKRLMDEVCKQQTIIGQVSQALNLCTSTVEFSGSREQVEGEKLLLLATHRRQAALNEIQRVKVEGTLRPVVPGASEVQESGLLTISAITLPLNDNFKNNDPDVCLQFVALIRHLDTVIATPVVQAQIGDSCVRFPSTLKVEDLYSDFKVTIEIYSLQTRAEVLPHEIKYHIHSPAHVGTTSKKGGSKTPKKLKHDNRLIMPCVQSPAGPAAVRSPAFLLTGYVIFSLKEVNRQQFTLNKVPANSHLEGRLQMHVSCELSVSVEHRGFLTMFEDVSGFGAWHRRWCLLKGDTLSYWKYPDDERKKTPIGSLELQGVVTPNIGLVSRDICARPHTFLLETVRPTVDDEPESLIIVRNGALTTVRHLLSADTKEDRLEWCSKLNQTLNLIRAWSGNCPSTN